MGDFKQENNIVNCELVDTEKKFKQNSGFRVWRIIYGSKNQVDTPRSLDNGGGEMYKPCIHSRSPHIYTITFVGVVELCAMLSYVVLIHDLTICWDPDN